MALSLNIPTSPSAYYSLAIEQKSYLLSFRWQTRGRCWYISIDDSEGNSLCKSVKLVPNMEIIRQNKDKGPAGSLFVIKRTNDAQQVPGRSNIGPGKDFELMYYSVAEGG